VFHRNYTNDCRRHFSGWITSNNYWRNRWTRWWVPSLCWLWWLTTPPSHMFPINRMFFKAIMSTRTTLRWRGVSIWISKFYAIFTSPNQFLLDRGIGLVAFGAD
jgi:hypothetical protein